MSADLYVIPIEGIAMTAPCGGNNNEDGEGEACLIIGRIPGEPDAYLIGDSKNSDTTPLRFFGSELRAWGIDTTKI
ncbi:hypothetical protein [Spongiactinospora sp. TRM90649]|uniref:hypothetical protein n=1 Tax=Spongiactinospora sp. TRM90649 TaxID=3031114 RepID=UPI0023F6DE9F|nr:hypothetical protein [Spongiactinospora sp. TRM90649]MDF5751448.1 hypothetical protein [Spongiactinospora sp. TRM90649]